MKIQSQLLLLGFTSTLAWGVSIAPSSAVNFVGNLPSNDGSSTILSSTSGTNIKAVSFTYGSGPDYYLDDVVLRLGDYDTSDSFSVEIRNNAGTNPGSTVLASLSLAPGEIPQGSTNAYYRFISNSSFTFQPSNTYWLYLSIAASSGNSGSIIWRSSLPTTTPVGIAAFGGYRFSNNAGASFANSNLYNSFQVNATAVPEPLTILGAIAAVGFGSAFKRRSNKSQVLSD
ncbi:MAG: hypothetical protein DCF12_20950 [Snowella sp.]|jgi:hypothetical protein|nr:MAG: hypothetical protein DCF12_20950 [Snowella sp.]